MSIIKSWGGIIIVRVERGKMWRNLFKVGFYLIFIINIIFINEYLYILIYVLKINLLVLIG